VKLRRGAPFLERDDMTRFAAADGVDVTAARMHDEVSPRHEQRRDPPDSLHRQVAVLVHVRDDQADLVGVRDDGDQRAIVRPDPGPDVAERVAVHAAAERAEAAADDVLHRRLEPRRTRRQAEITEQVDMSRHRPPVVPPQAERGPSVRHGREFVMKGNTYLVLRTAQRRGAARRTHNSTARES
jgi:hypothetical protein